MLPIAIPDETIEEIIKGLYRKIVDQDIALSTNALEYLRENLDLDKLAEETFSKVRVPSDGIDGLMGEKGEQGDKGEKGDKGDPGPEGKQGIKGKDGKKGRDGLDYKLSMDDKKHIINTIASQLPEVDSGFSLDEKKSLFKEMVPKFKKEIEKEIKALTERLRRGIVQIPQTGGGGGGGSHDNTTPPFIPYKKGGRFRNSPMQYDEQANEIVSTASIRVPPGTYFIGEQLALKDATGGLYYTRLFDDRKFAPAAYGWDDTGTVLSPFTVDFGPKVIRSVIQPDDTGEFLGTQIIVPRTAVNNEFISKSYGKFGNTLPPDDLIFKLYINSIDPKNLIVNTVVKDVCESGTFVANTEFCFDLAPLVRLMVGQDFFLIWESASPFSLKTNAAGTIPWEAVDTQDGMAYRLLDTRDSSSGDMLKSVYDPSTVEGDAFSMGNMEETATEKILSDTERTKLSGIEAGAEVNQSDSEIKTQYENNADTNAFTDSNVTKLGGIEAGAQVNQTDAEIKAQYEANPDTNAYTDSEKLNLSNQSGANTGDVTLDAGQTTQDSFDLTGQELKGNLVTQTTDGLMSQQDKIELDNISANGAGDGWKSGLDVDEDSPKGTTVLYGSGTYLINGEDKTIASNGSYDTANGYGSVDHYSGMTNDQHAIVTLYVDADEVVKSIRGDIGEKGDTIFPALQPGDTVCFAYVEIKVDKNDIPKDIDNKHIFDCRTSPSINTDETVSVSVDDQSTGFLADKLSNNGNVTFTIENVGGDETLRADTAGGGATVPPSILYTGTAHIDGLDVTPLYPRGVLWIDSTADINLQSFQNGQDKQILIVVNLSLKKLRFDYNTGTYDKILTEGAADVIADKYGGGTLIYNASKSSWYQIQIN